MSSVEFCRDVSPDKVLRLGYTTSKSAQNGFNVRVGKPFVRPYRKTCPISGNVYVRLRIAARKSCHPVPKFPVCMLSPFGGANVLPSTGLCVITSVLFQEKKSWPSGWLKPVDGGLLQSNRRCLERLLPFKTQRQTRNRRCIWRPTGGWKPYFAILNVDVEKTNAMLDRQCTNGRVCNLGFGPAKICINDRSCHGVSGDAGIVLAIGRLIGTRTFISGKSRRISAYHAARFPVAWHGSS